MKSVEIKARYKRSKKTTTLLERISARSVKSEEQTDVHFRIDIGGLMIRKHDSGVSKLVHYYREEDEGPRVCHYEEVTLKSTDRIREMLEEEHGIYAVVKKKREIWEVQ